ncbi:MAG: hypothetical protein RMK91_05265 [Pseudanabaenaceae cyanobacterium SKYGB_i_bin29]|nr:hypothetical protein [Pseudanabaenaceae cyanobacterium SKYG29]MDW8421257.1 hypothetical protein [Pseudanabaenaceae cyanobacterium SKYGB_i_bin29]
MLNSPMVLTKRNDFLWLPNLPQGTRIVAKELKSGMRKYSAVAMGLMLVGLLSACGDPNEEVTRECSVYFDKDGNITREAFENIPKPRLIKTQRRNLGQICQQVRELANNKQLRFCSATNIPPCVIPAAEDKVAEAKPLPKVTMAEPFTAPPIVQPPVDLIDPIDREERLKQLKATEGRKDPFQELDAQIPPLPPPPKATAAPPPRPRPPRAPRGTIVVKEPIAAPSEVPPPPEPVEAKQVRIAGVLQIGSEVLAIASIPGDRLPSRTIRPGQRIADGKVLVKAIDITGLTPSVVLEQFGTEVRRGVGEAIAVASETPQPTP